VPGDAGSHDAVITAACISQTFFVRVKLHRKNSENRVNLSIQARLSFAYIAIAQELP